MKKSEYKWNSRMNRYVEIAYHNKNGRLVPRIKKVMPPDWEPKSSWRFW